MEHQAPHPTTTSLTARASGVHRAIVGTALDRRPAHLPEWAWEGYKRHVAKIKHPDWEPNYLVALSTDARVRLCTQIVANKNSERLWKMLEANWVELDRDCGSPDPERHVVNMFEATEITCHDMHPQQRLTKDERRPFADAIVEATSDLSSALRRVRALSRPECPEYPEGFTHFDHDDFLDLLNEISRSAERWRAAPPQFGRPNRVGSDERYFGRQMAIHLKELYPDAEVDRIASLLADCIDFKALN